MSRADAARRLVAGWEAAEAELCTNLWFGDADRLGDDAGRAFGTTVQTRIMEGNGTVPLPPLDRLGRAWTDPLLRAQVLRDEDLGPVGLASLLDDDVPAVPSGEAFATALARGDDAAARAALRPLLEAGSGTGPRAERFEDVFGRWVLPELTSGPVAHRPADAAFVDDLVRISARTARAAPRLFASAWQFVSDVVVIAEADAATLAEREDPMPDSFSQPGLSGVVFFSPWVLGFPWHAEVTVLHEAVHQKLYTLLLTRPLFDAVMEEAVTIRVPWRDTEWELRRAISACHAYVHMATVLGGLLQWAADHDEPLEPSDGGGDDPLVLAQVHVERMLFLAEAVARYDRTVLGEAGVDLVRWLNLIALELGRTCHRPQPGLGVYP